MRNVKYAYYGLSKRIGFSILAVFQLTASFFFLYTGIYLNHNLTQKNNKILDLIDNKIIYTIDNKDADSTDKYLADNLETSDKIENINNFLKTSGDFTQISYTNSFTLLTPFNDSVKFSDNNLPFVSVDSHTYSHVYSLAIDDKYLKYFPLSVTQGSAFKDGDFNINIGETDIPVILGAKYKDIFKLNSSIEYYNTDTRSTKKLKVIGFLDSNQYFITGGTTLYNLDNYILLPQQKIIKFTSDNALKQNEDIVRHKVSLSIDILSSLIIIDKNQNDNKDEIIENLVNKVNENKIFSVEAHNMMDSINNIIEVYKTENIIINTIFFIIFIFCSLGIISNMLYSISKRFNEFGIHILSGATIYDILMRTFFEVVLLVGFATAICAVLVTTLGHIAAIKFETLSFLKLIAINIALALIISVLPILRILKIQTGTLIRGKE